MIEAPSPPPGTASFLVDVPSDIRRQMASDANEPSFPLVENGQYPSYTGKGPMSKYRTDNVGWRLAKRKELFTRKRKAAYVSLALAVSGMILMMIETEITIAMLANGVQWKKTIGSVLIKLSITASTVMLMLAVGWYYMTDIKLFMVDNSLDDWRLALSRKRVMHFICEEVVCFLHPMPGDWELYYQRVEVGETVAKTQKVSLDVLMSLPMFLRVYLVFRVMVLSSKLYSDARSQSLGALNRIQFDFKFLFKSLMTSHPGTVQTILCSAIFIAGSWCFRACEMYHPESRASILNAMWLMAITFLTIGYGDYVPRSYCGRVIAVSTGMLGVGCTALIVAVLARKLELSRSEKYVHSFVTDIHLDKQFKNAAANILREGWLIYRAKKRNKSSSVRKHQRRLLESIHKLREIRTEQRRLTDGAITIVEMGRAQELMHEKVMKITARQENMEQTLMTMAGQFAMIDQKLDRILDHRPPVLQPQRPPSGQGQRY